MICSVCRRRRECYSIAVQPERVYVMTHLGLAQAIRADDESQPRTQNVCSMSCQSAIERGRDFVDRMVLPINFVPLSREAVLDMDEPERAMTLDVAERAGTLPWLRVN